MNPIQVVGDGLAGLLLAGRLKQAGMPFLLHGDGRTNTPPVALVHLFAGRTFRRSALELKAFERAVAHWRTEPLALERTVRRRVEPGDRLDRSALDHDVPSEWAPRRGEDGWLEYGPAFSVAAQCLESRLRQDLGECVIGRVDPMDFPPPRVLALGLGAADQWPDASWDLSGGRTMEALAGESPASILIGCGLHLAPDPAGGSSVTLGGRFSPSGPLGDELEKAFELTGACYREISSWSGKRCALATDRKPVLGWLDGETFAFSGFGSRGLFWLPYCLELALSALSDRTFSVPSELDVSRLGFGPK